MTTVRTTTTQTTARPGRQRRRRRWLAGLAAFAVLVAGYATWTNLRPYTLQASTQIAATPEQVWAVLTDLRDYPRWNPFLVSSAGTLQPGATLTNVMHDRTGDTTFRPVVQVVEPGRELRWIGKFPPGGLFTGVHSFTIREVTPGHVVLTQREEFTGVAVPFFQGQLKSDTLPQFQAMNAALAGEVASRAAG